MKVRQLCICNSAVSPGVQHASTGESDPGTVCCTAPHHLRCCPVLQQSDDNQSIPRLSPVNRRDAAKKWFTDCNPSPTMPFPSRSNTPAQHCSVSVFARLTFPYWFQALHSASQIRLEPHFHASFPYQRDYSQDQDQADRSRFWNYSSSLPCPISLSPGP